MKVADLLSTYEEQEQQDILTLIPIYEEIYKDEAELLEQIRTEEALLRQEVANIKYFTDALNKDLRGFQEFQNWKQINECSRSATNTFLRLIALKYVGEEHCTDSEIDL